MTKKLKKRKRKSALEAQDFKSSSRHGSKKRKKLKERKRKLKKKTDEPASASRPTDEPASASRPTDEPASASSFGVVVWVGHVMLVVCVENAQ